MRGIPLIIDGWFAHRGRGDGRLAETISSILLAGFSPSFCPNAIQPRLIRADEYQHFTK